MADNIGAIFSVDFESFGDIKKKLDILTKQINSTANGKVKLDVNIDGIEKAVQDINNLKKQNIQVLGNGQVKTVSVLNDELNRTIKLVENLTTGKKSISIDNNLEKDKENLISQSKYLDNITTRLKSYQQILNNRGNNSNAQKQLNSEIQEQINKYEQLRSENKLLNSEEKARINENLNQTKLQTSQLTAQQNGLSSILKNTASYAIGGSAIYATINQLQNGIKAIHDIDDALRDLKRVSDDVANSTLNNFVNKANNMAVSLGHTTEGVIQATAMFKQLGYSFKDASEYMASNAMILSNVGDISVQDSSNAIVSTLKGFKMEAQDTTKVVDVLNETGNNFAITTGQLSEGLRIGSASLAIANNSLEESTALITTGTEVLRDSDMVANGLKTIGMRLRGIKDEEGNLEPKMRELVKSLSGKDIMNANGSFKSTYEIMKDLGSVWDTLSDKQRAFLAETVAGKNRANVFSAIMQNSQQLEKVYDTATNSAGSAQKEQEAYMNSMSGKINALKENFKGLFIDTINSEALKEVIDIANGGITVFRELGNQFGSLPVLISTIVASLNVFSTKFNESFMGQLPILKQMNSFFDSWKASIKADTVATSVNTVSKEANNVASATGIVNSKGETISTVANTGAKIANTTATVASTFATGAMTVAVSALQAVMSFGLSLAVTGIISGIMKLGDSLITTKAELKEFNEETSKTVSETQKSVSSAENYIKKIEELNNAISSAGDEEKKKELTEQLTQAQKDLAQAMPEATNDFGDDGKEMATSIEFTKEIIQLKKDEMKINAQKFFDENKGLLSDIDGLAEKKRKLEEYQVALAQGKTSVKQNFDTVENGQTVSKEYDVKISSDDVKKLNEDIMQTTKTASEARVMAKYLGDDVTDSEKKSIESVENYTKSLQKNTEEKKNNKNVNLKDLTPEQQQSVHAENINVLSGAVKELNSTSNLSENAVKKLADVMPNLDLSNMSAKEKVEALTNALKDQKDQMDKNSEIDAKDGQKSFMEQEEGIGKINGYLEEMKKNGQMSADIMKELATNDLFTDFTGDLTNMASVQDYFNSKVENMRSIQNSAYQQMMGNSQSFYKNQMNNGNSLQSAYERWANHYVNANDSSYRYDASNYNTLNQAKNGMLQNMSSVMSNYLSNLVGGSAEAYKKDLDACKNWGDMKTKVLSKLDEQLAKLNSNFATGSSIMAQITKLEAVGLDTPQQQAIFEKTKQIQADIQAQIQNLMNNRKQIEADFDNINMGDLGWTPPSSPTTPYKGVEYKGGGSDGSSGSDAQKTINYINDEYDALLDLKDAVEKVNNAIEQNQTLAENTEDQKKIDLMKQQIDLYNQLRDAQSNLKNGEIGQKNSLKQSLLSQGFTFNGDDLVGSQNRLEQLKNSLNSKMNGDTDSALSNQYNQIKKWVESYSKLVRDEIPNITKDIIDINNKILASQKEISEELQKQRDKFIKDEETKTETIKKELEKQRKIREDEKNKEDKQDELGEKQKSLNDLQQKLVEAQKTGDSELIKEARKNIEDSQRELNQYTRDQNYEEQINRISDEETKVEDTSKSKIDNINKQLSDDNILKLVQQGVTNIDSMLKNVKANTADITTPFYTVENVIKSRLLPLTEQMSKNALTTVATIRSGLVGNLGIDSNMTVIAKDSQPTSINIKQGDTIIQGSITEEVYPKVKSMIDDMDDKFEKFKDDVIDAVRVN